MDYIHSLGLYMLLAWSRFKAFCSESQIITANWMRQNVDGDLWIWPSGRISLHEPLTIEDRKNCWEYRALTGTLTWLPAGGRVKRWPWVSLAISFTPDGEAVDYTDVLDNLKFCSGGMLPPPQVVNALLSQKIGRFIGDKAVYTVSPKMDPLEKIRFPALPQSEADLSAWDAAWL